MTEPVDRARYLPALIEALIAGRDVDAATEASEELSEIASVYGRTMIAAAAHSSNGRLLVAAGRPAEAMPHLSRAIESWREFDAPYEVARVRALLGQAYRELGDDDSASLELDAARVVMERLGARPDVERIDMAAGRRHASVLTGREVEVLRLVAEGKTNKVIAAELYVSDRTIDRHVSNIFTKLGVTSRTAAAAHAIEHGLI
jgi:DNA-binding CsgD family transcriptional regulator